MIDERFRACADRRREPLDHVNLDFRRPSPDRVRDAAAARTGPLRAAATHPDRTMLRDGARTMIDALTNRERRGPTRRGAGS
jgi:hypothetical protein